MEDVIPDVCIRCDVGFIDQGPIIQLLCGHREHTRCFFNMAIAQRNIPHMICEVCREYIIPNEMIHEEIEIETETEMPLTTSEKISMKYSQNEKFRTGVKAYIETLRSLKKAHSELNHVIKQKKTSMDTEITLIKEQLQNLVESRITNIRMTPEYKNYVKLNASLKIRLRQLNAIESESSNSSLKEALGRKPGLRKWPSLTWCERRSASRILYRAFYYKIRI